MEEYLILSDQDVSIYENGVQAQWVPITAAAIRMLTSKVGKKEWKKDGHWLDRMFKRH